MCFLYLVFSMIEPKKVQRNKIKNMPDKDLKEDSSLSSLSAKNVAVTVDTWKKIAADKRSDAMHAAFVLLMSDFLFADISLPDPWFHHLEKLKMFEKSQIPKIKALSEAQMIVVEMLFKAQDFVVSDMLKSRYDLLAMVEFIMRVESTAHGFEKVMNLAKGQEQMEKICEQLLQSSSQRYPTGGRQISEVELTAHEFASSHERRLLVALLVSRAVANIILKIGSKDGSSSSISDLLANRDDTEDAVLHRKRGNEQFQRHEYETALTTYTAAIGLSKYSAVSYCNRCQTALKLKNYKLAISDGYRAIALKPKWGKAYYRQAEAFKEDNKLLFAIVWNEKGLTMAESDSEKDELRKQQAKFRDVDKSSDTSMSKKSKKSKKKKKTEEDCLPELVSDEDSMKEFSDTEYDKETRDLSDSLIRSVIQNTDFTIQFEKGGKPPVIKTKRLKPPSMVMSELKYRREIAAHIGHSKNSDKVKEENREKNEKKNSVEKQPKPIAVEKQKKEAKVEVNLAQVFTEQKCNGSTALVQKEFLTAINQYDSAIDCMEKIQVKGNPKVSRTDRFLLLYSRGWVSLEIRSPQEVAKSLDFFAMLMGPNISPSEVIHPVAYYAVAHAQYLLNNFFMISNPLNLGINMMKEKRIKRMKWPGIDVFIPESEPDHLLKLMKDLLSAPQHPPKPDAICFYDHCDKDDKNEVHDYAMCDKEIYRKEIYNSDFNFEGYMKIYCSWDCIVCFHYKCWSKFKHNNYKKTGDKDILDVDCLTDGCKGSLCRIVMIDEKQNVKKDVTSDKASSRDKGVNKKISNTRMSKNERNLSKRLKQLEEAKDKKIQSKKKSDDTSAKNRPATKIAVKPREVRVFTDEEIENATIITRANEVKVKNPKTKSKKRYNAVTINTFLANSRNRLDMAEIEQMIINSQAADMPFQVPDELREEIAQFENELSDEEIFWTTWIYEYFENFFDVNGPVKVQDDLLLQQQLLFPHKMKQVIEKHNDIISFLCKNQHRFLIVAPYIGLPQQQEQLVKLANEFQMSLKPKKNTSRQTNQSASMLDTLDCDFDGPSTLSDFARDLYDVGEVSLSQVRNITGSGAPVAIVQGRDPEESMLRPKVVKTSNNEDPLKSNPTKSNSNPWMDGKVANRGRGDELDDFLCTEMDDYLLNKISKESEPAFVSPNGDGEKLTQEMSFVASSTSESDDEETSSDDSCTHAATQTSLIPSYEEEIKNLKQESKALNSKVKNLDDELSRLKSSSRAELVSKNNEMKETKEKLTNLQKKLTDLTLSYESDKKKAAKERSSWQENAKIVNDKLKEALNKNQELEGKVRIKEEDCDRLSMTYQEQRSMWLEEKANTNREKEALRSQLQLATQRVLEAELKSLESDKKYSLKLLLKARNDCERIVADFEKLMRLYSNNQTAQAEVVKGYQKWKINIDTCTQYIEQAKQQFQVNSNLLRSGKHLNELPQVQVPPPPPPGPSLQQVAAVAMRLSNMGTNMQTHSSMPLNNQYLMSSSSPPLMSNGGETISSLPTARLPQPPIGTGKQQAAPTPKSNNIPAPIPTPAQSEPPSTSSSSSSQPKGSFEKIMIKLQTLFPNVSRQDLALCIKEVRQNNNNSLTGLSFDDIVQQASRVVNRKNLSPTSSSSMGLSSVANPSNSSSWPNNRNSQSSLSFSGDDPCVICHDPLNYHPIHKLKCEHVFHSKCLNKWFERNRTCPTCREYAIDTAEFPSLNRSFI